MGKKIKITIAIVLMVLSIPFCKRWFSTVEYYFSDEGEKATSSLKYRLTGTKTVEVAGLERFWSGEVIIPEKTIYCGYLCTVTSIGKKAFYGCSRITSVKIPTSVTEIGDYAFKGCSSLRDVEIPMSVTDIGKYAFLGCSGLTSVEIPSSVTEIGWCAFSGCSGLASVEIPSSVTEIGGGTFSDCSGLASVEIPSSVTEIGWCAFSGCSGLKRLEIPSSVTEIGNYAFKNCYNLIIVIDNYKNKVKVGYEAFEGCKSVTWREDM